LGERREAGVAELETAFGGSGARVGEIGWDTGVEEPGAEEQEVAWMAQMELASRRGVAATVHAVGGWGRGLEALRRVARPARGFLLHSYGGSPELVAPLAELGAYFGFSGAMLGERRARALAAFRRVPPERLLIESDAPWQRVPEEVAPEAGRAVAALGLDPDDPARVVAVYHGYAALFGERVEAVAERVAANFARLFGGGD
jgi:TatD DNase family protein